MRIVYGVLTVVCLVVAVFVDGNTRAMMLGTAIVTALWELGEARRK